MLKRCGICSAEFTSVPEGAKYLAPPDPFAGWYWQCECGTTHYQKDDGSGKP
jgi:hypothetical protein